MEAALSYVAWAGSDMHEELVVEPAISVESFVEKVRDEFFLPVHRLTFGGVDLLCPRLAGSPLRELVPPGSRVLVNGEELSCAVGASGAACPDAGSSAPEPPRSEPAARFSVGDAVRIVGLKKRPELNECRGRIVRWVASKQRWQVRLDSMKAAEPPLGLAASNLERVPAAPVVLKTGFLSGGSGVLQDRRSAPRGALLILCGGGHTGPKFRDRLMEVQLEGGSFEEQLTAAGIARCVFPFPKGAGGDVDWFDPRAATSPEVPEDVAGIAHSMEQVDGEIDHLVKEEGIPPHRIGVLGYRSGGCLALHLVYGAGRHAGELGAVACARGFLSKDSVCFSAAASTWRSSGSRPSPRLFMSHGEADRQVTRSWLETTRCGLGAAGVRVPEEVVSFPGAGDELCAAELQQLVEFFCQCLIEA